MATAQTVLAETQHIPMTELGRQPVRDGTGTSTLAGDPPADAIEAETDAPIGKLVVAGFSFLCAGINDGTLGPLIPYMLTAFGIGTSDVAIM